MKATDVRRIVVIGTLAALATTGCATKKASSSWTGDVVADRQRLMKLHGALWKDIQDKAKAGNIELVHLPYGGPGGMQDVIGGQIAATISEAVPDSRLIKVPSVAHLPSLEAPQAFNRLLGDSWVNERG